MPPQQPPLPPPPPLRSNTFPGLLPTQQNMMHDTTASMYLMPSPPPHGPQQVPQALGVPAQLHPMQQMGSMGSGRGGDSNMGDNNNTSLFASTGLGAPAVIDPSLVNENASSLLSSRPRLSRFNTYPTTTYPQTSSLGVPFMGPPPPAPLASHPSQFAALQAGAFPHQQYNTAYQQYPHVPQFPQPHPAQRIDFVPSDMVPPPGLDPTGHDTSVTASPSSPFDMDNLKYPIPSHPLPESMHASSSMSSSSFGGPSTFPHHQDPDIFNSYFDPSDVGRYIPPTSSLPPHDVLPPSHRAFSSPLSSVRGSPLHNVPSPHGPSPHGNGNNIQPPPPAMVPSMDPATAGPSVAAAAKAEESEDDQPPRPSNAWILYRSSTLTRLKTGDRPPGLDEALREIGVDPSKPPQPPPKPAKPSKGKGKKKKDGGSVSEALLALGYGKAGRGLPQADISRLISILWKREPLERKKHFEYLYRKETQEHAEKYPDYKFQPQRKEVKAAKKLLKAQQREEARRLKEARNAAQKQKSGPKARRRSRQSPEAKREMAMWRSSQQAGPSSSSGPSMAADPSNQPPTLPMMPGIQDRWTGAGSVAAMDAHTAVTPDNVSAHGEFPFHFNPSERPTLASDDHIDNPYLAYQGEMVENPYLTTPGRPGSSGAPHNNIPHAHSPANHMTPTPSQFAATSATETPETPAQNATMGATHLSYTAMSHPHVHPIASSVSSLSPAHQPLEISQQQQQARHPHDPRAGHQATQQEGGCPTPSPSVAWYPGPPQPGMPVMANGHAVMYQSIPSAPSADGGPQPSQLAVGDSEAKHHHEQRFPIVYHSLDPTMPPAPNANRKDPENLASVWCSSSEEELSAAYAAGKLPKDAQGRPIVPSTIVREDTPMDSWSQHELFSLGAPGALISAQWEALQSQGVDTPNVQPESTYYTEAANGYSATLAPSVAPTPPPLNSATPVGGMRNVSGTSSLGANLDRASPASWDAFSAIPRHLVPALSVDPATLPRQSSGSWDRVVSGPSVASVHSAAQTPEPDWGPGAPLGITHGIPVGAGIVNGMVSNTPTPPPRGRPRAVGAKFTPETAM